MIRIHIPVSLLLAIFMIVVVSGTQPARATDDPRLIQLSTAMATELMHHYSVNWEQSMVNSAYPRLSAIAGVGERLVHFFSEENGDTLGFLLTAKDQPSVHQDNFYVNFSKERWPNGKSPEKLLADAIIASNGNLLPDDVLGMAMQQIENDYWAALLVTHNLLKEVAYSKRYGLPAIIGFDIAAPDNVDMFVTINPDQVLDKLASIRPPADPNVNDKIGPWYHMFGILFVGAITSPTEAQFAANMESLTRWFGLGSNQDPFKEELTLYAAEFSEVLNYIAVNHIIAPTEKQRATSSKEWLQGKFDELRNEHKRLQDELNAFNAAVQTGGAGASDGLVWRMDFIRSLQTAIYAEAKLTQDAINSR
jgi:hypothetical protein